MIFFHVCCKWACDLRFFFTICTIEMVLELNCTTYIMTVHILQNYMKMLLNTICNSNSVLFSNQDSITMVICAVSSAIIERTEVLLTNKFSHIKFCPIGIYNCETETVELWSESEWFRPLSQQGHRFVFRSSLKFLAWLDWSPITTCIS